MSSRFLDTIDDSPQATIRMLQRELAETNREVLGLHYPSDSVAGRDLADQTFNLMKPLTTLTNIFKVAKKEWA